MGKSRKAENYDTTEHCWIEMPDGVRLAARIWLPESARSEPVPAIFEYIPYRKVDMVRARDERNHPYLAENGFAALRIDMRGSGDSEGQMSDMYSWDELEDSRHIIEWLTQQPWCNGKVGMFGTSWGGTASLQANVDAPAALKAIIAVCATHDRYEDDIHHMGGCLLTDSIEWGATLPTILGAPQSLNIGEDWRIHWENRLEKLAFPLDDWLRNEDRGSYWRHGSVVYQADRLRAPMLCVGGWADRYSNSVMSLIDRRPDLTWGIVGPWGHHYPDKGHPGPGIGFQEVMLDWWRHWLLADETTTPGWPRVRAWIREFDTPADSIDKRSGKWVQSAAPKECTNPVNWYLANGSLIESRSTLRSDLPLDLHVGTTGADTGYFGRFGGLPPDQRGDDDASLCFNTEPLEKDLLIYGALELDLELEADDPRRQLCLRLNDVAPDGTSARITWAVRNLVLNDDLDAPETPVPDGRRTIYIRFPYTAYRIRAGHKLRLAVSQSYWPMVWTPPTIGRVTLFGGCLTVRVPKTNPEPLAVEFPNSKDLPKVKSYTVTNDAQIVRHRAMIEGGQVLSGWYQPYTSVHYEETDTAFGYETRAEFRIRQDDPLSAECTYEHSMTFDRPDGSAVVSCKVHLSADSHAYHVTGTFCATWDGRTVKTHEWILNIARVYS